MNQRLSLVLIVISLVLDSGAINLCKKDTSVSKYQYRKGEMQLCRCPKQKNCIRKCCKPGYEMNRKFCTLQTNSTENVEFETVPIYKERNVSKSNNFDFTSNFIVGVMKCDFYDLNPSVNQNDDFYIQENGSVWVPSFSKYFSNNFYCADGTETKNLRVFVCFEEDLFSDEVAKYVAVEVNVIGMIISMPFLLTTFLVYALLPDRNLHAKALMFYTLSLFFGYLILVIIQLSKADFPRALCQTLGFSVQFFFILSFFWMNVICADIWFTFSGYRRFSVGKRSAETKRFILYCLYACGMSFLITFITLLINTYADDSSDSAFRNFHPNIGNGQCFLRGTWPELLYFYGPMGLILATNMIFFAITAFKIRQAKKDTSVLKKGDSKRHSYENDKQNFKLYLRLLLAMGINWTMELISWAVQAGVSEVPNYVWYVTDFCNAIYGVFIFFLFVFKKKIWKLLKKRYYTFIGKPQLGHFTSDTTNQTRTSNYSTAETSLTDNHHHSIHREEIPLRTST